MKILISGVTGFVGAHMMRYFHSKGHHVIGLGRVSAPPDGLTKFGKYKAVKLDENMPRERVDVCIHCAGYASDKGRWEDFYANNVLTTKHIFQQVDCTTFINISSASIYPLLANPISESQVDVNAFPSLYGRSKWEAEALLSAANSDKETVISLRPRAIYGTHDRILLPRILEIAKSGAIRLPGGGNVLLSMTNINNLLAATDLALHSKLVGFHAFNVADERPYNLGFVFESLVSGILNKPVQVKPVPKWLVRMMIMISGAFGEERPLSRQAFDYLTKPTTLNIEKIKSALDYRPVTNFTEQLPNIVQWARSIDQDLWIKDMHLLPWSKIGQNASLQA